MSVACTWRYHKRYTYTTVTMHKWLVAYHLPVHGEACESTFKVLEVPRPQGAQHTAEVAEGAVSTGWGEE